MQKLKLREIISFATVKCRYLWLKPRLVMLKMQFYFHILTLSITICQKKKKTLNIGPTSWPPDPYGGPIHRRACAWFNVAVKILLSINKIPYICILHKAPHIMQLVLLCSYVKHFGRLHAPFHTPGFCFTNVGAAAFARRMGAWCEPEMWLRYMTLVKVWQPVLDVWVILAQGLHIWDNQPPRIYKS